MGLQREYDDNEYFSDFPLELEEEQSLSHKKRVRKKLEARLERRKLKEEFDELDGEFYWDELDK